MIEEYDDQDNGDQIPNSLQKGKNIQIMGQTANPGRNPNFSVQNENQVLAQS